MKFYWNSWKQYAIEPDVREDLTNKLHRHSSPLGFQCHCLFSSISTTTSTNIETISRLIWSHDTNKYLKKINLDIQINFGADLKSWHKQSSFDNNSCRMVTTKFHKKAHKSICVPLALHFGCHGINILCSCSNLHMDQRSIRAQRSTNLRENFLASTPDCNILSIWFHFLPSFVNKPATLIALSTVLLMLLKISLH